jgi:hypothetical protein
VPARVKQGGGGGGGAAGDLYEARLRGLWRHVEKRGGMECVVKGGHELLAGPGGGRVTAFARQIVKWKWSRARTCGQASRRRGQSRRPTAGATSQCVAVWRDERGWASRHLQRIGDGVCVPRAAALRSVRQRPAK